MGNGIAFHRYTIFDGDEGYEHNGLIYRLVVGVPISISKDGTLFCSWMSGTGGEPEQGHCAMYSVSKDYGKTWSKPEVFVEPAEVNGSGSIFDMDGRLYMTKNRWPLEALYTVNNYTIAESDDNGKTWTDEKPVKFWTDDILSSHAGMLKLMDGSWIGISGLIIERDKPLRASVEKLAFANNEQEAAAMPPEEEKPQYNDMWVQKKYIMGVGFFRCDNHFNDFEFLGTVHNRPLGLIEPSLVELSDGTLSLLCRAELGGYVWRTDSHDKGKTWCDAYETDIPSASTLVKTLRLPDGRIALVFDPLGKKGERGSRSKLSLWISDDDMKTWYLKEDIAEGGYLSYPSAIVLPNGQFAVTYEDRRHAYFVEVDLPKARKINQ